MKRDDVIRWADEADLWADQELQCIGEYHPDWHEVRDIRFAALVAAAERERLHDKFMEIHKSQQQSNNYWHFAARKIKEEA